jgi:putative lipoic acid-binding regulatory protein
MASKFPPEGVEEQPETLLEFPCKFPIKAMGRDIDGFKELVEKIVFEHAGVYPGEVTTTNSSETGKFVSVTVTIEATSKAQLDCIYLALTDCEQVVIAL